MRSKSSSLVYLFDTKLFLSSKEAVDELCNEIPLTQVSWQPDSCVQKELKIPAELGTWQKETCMHP